MPPIAILGLSLLQDQSYLVANIDVLLVKKFKKSDTYTIGLLTDTIITCFLSLMKGYQKLGCY